jgi:hypothetical protein
VAASPSRPALRTAGIALLGVGVIAATIGLFTAVTGGGGGTNTAAPASSVEALPSVAPGAPATAVAPTAAPSAPVDTAAPATPQVAAPAPAPTGAAEPAPAEPARPAAGAASGGGGGPATRAPVRVYNNSLVKGLAARAQSDFEGAGWQVTAASNYSAGNIPTSTVYFRPGTGEEAAAQELGQEFGLRVEPRFNGLDEASPGVIVIVTNDYRPGRKSQ